MKPFLKSIFCILFISVIIVHTDIYAQKSPVTISGVIMNIKVGKVSLCLSGQESSPITQSQIDTTGKFSLSGVIPRVDIYKLQFDIGKFITLILVPGEKVNITCDMNDLMSTLKIIGSEQSSNIYETDKRLKQYKSQLDSINSQYSLAVGKNPSDPLLLNIVDDYHKMEKAQSDYIISFVTKNPGSLTCLFFIDKLSIEDHFETYKLLDINLYKNYPENTYVIGFHTKVQNAAKLAVGELAPEISLPDTNGKIINLSSFKGKIVLIDFWASWCGPCRRESPNMVKMYSLFNNKGLEIYSVSLDKTRESWIKAIKDDKLTWTHVSDIKFWQCEAAKAYNVSGIPYTVLLDREGKIISKGLRGADLEKKLDEILK
jgi:peroxiredoxin